MNWGQLVSIENYMVGEVAFVDDNLVDVFVYPEKFNVVYKGAVLLVDGRRDSPIGIVIKKAHEASYSSFTPLRQTREQLEKSYPDLNQYHRFVSTIVYTSILRNNVVHHFRSIMPLLHDRVFLVSDKELLDKFFKPQGEWDFTFLDYMIREIETKLIPVDVREFFLNHSEYFSSYHDEREEIIRALSKALSDYPYNLIVKIVRELDRIWR